MSDLPVLVGSSGPKFLLPQEKISRWVFGIGFGAVIVGVGIKVLPYVIHFAELGIEAGFKLLVLGSILGIIGAITTFLLNPKVQAAAWYMYMGVVDAFALRIAKVNPVARVKAYVSHYLEPMAARCQGILDRAIGREKSAQRRVDETVVLLEKSRRRAQYCVEHGRPDGRTWNNKELRAEFSVLSAKIHPMEEALKRLQKRLAFQHGCVAVLQDLQTVIASYIQVTQFNVDMMVQEFESAEEAAEGSRDVQGMLGASEKTKFYNMAAKELMLQTDQMMAEVEGVMAVVQHKISDGKIDDAIGEEDLLQQLTGRVSTMSTFAEGQRQLAEGGEATLFTNVKRALEAVPVETKLLGASSSDPSNRFRQLLPPR